MVIGNEKGSDTQSRVRHNFGAARPEGYRKALSKMQTAAKFGLPIVCFIDTTGAYPGIGAEERGQASAIAWNILEMSALPVPIVTVMIEKVRQISDADARKLIKAAKKPPTSQPG